VIIAFNDLFLIYDLQYFSFYNAGKIKADFDLSNLCEIEAA